MIPHQSSTVKCGSEGRGRSSHAHDAQFFHKQSFDLHRRKQNVDIGYREFKRFDELVAGERRTQYLDDAEFVLREVGAERCERLRVVALRNAERDENIFGEVTAVAPSRKN